MTIDERTHDQAIFMKRNQGNLVMERKLNGFIRKEKDEIKNKKGMYAT